MHKPRTVAVTANNVTLYSEVHAALEDSLVEIIAMLNEDDYPVEFWHQSGFRKTFWSPEEAKEYVAGIRADIDRFLAAS